AIFFSLPALGGLGPDGIITMHRRAAGSPDAEGWYHAKSTEGHFSVALPRPFNDSTSRRKDGEGALSRVQRVQRRPSGAHAADPAPARRRHPAERRMPQGLGVARHP